MKLINKVLGVAAAMIVAMGVASPAIAADNGSSILEKISKTRTLKVGMSGGQPPFNMKNRDGQLIGLDVDLAQLLANSMRVDLEIVEMSFVKLLPALEDGDIDLVISGVTATIERNTRVAFVGPYFVSGTSILTKQSTVESIDSPEELAEGEWSVSVLRGSTSESLVEEGLNNPAISATETYDEALQLLLDDKVSVMFGDAPTLALSVLRNPNAGLVALDEAITIEPIGIAVAPGDPLLLNLIENYMQALAATGALDSLQSKWFENGAWLAQMP